MAPKKRFKHTMDESGLESTMPPTKRSKPTMAESSSESTMVNWSALRMDLVRAVGDCLLATNDVDSYVDMRAVCHNWRAAIPKPTPLGAGDDLRFRPREWVMLDEEEPDDGVDGRLFLHLSTGRFLRRRLPQLDSGILVGDSDGLLAFGDDKGLHAARLLNPFTGDMLPFAAPIPREDWVGTAVAGTSPTLLFTFRDLCNNRIDMVYCAHATSQLCEVQFQCLEDKRFDFNSRVSYAGHLYIVDDIGGILKIVGTAPDYHGELILKTFKDNRFHYYLVVSAGELLLVKRDGFGGTEMDRFEVYRVDLDRKVLELVTNIGSRALFIGDRCLSLNVDGNCPMSVDGNWLNSVCGNCIYYFADPYADYFTNMKLYDLNNGNVETISFMDPETENFRPFSIAQTLLEYCIYFPSIGQQLKCLRS